MMARLENLGAMRPDDDGEEPLYDYHKVYSRMVSGPIRRMKWAILAVLLAIYYIAPWIRWDRGPDAPDQALLIDMVGRRAYFFGLEIWPQEIYYLMGLLILGAIGLFFATALFGRVWCGYTCPQTVWTDLYIWIERLFEGDRNRRIKFDNQPWGLKKLAIKSGKHLVWLLIAVATGGAWVFYFNDAPTLLPQLFTGEAGAGVYTFLAIFTATTYTLAGWAREQVCIYMCPWPRFQGSMVDEHSLIVTYAAWRGEPRGSGKKVEDAEQRGDCVDCGLCVQVCPTGIDIRDGLQLGCIGCGLCIDACNAVMDKVGSPRGLIAWDSSAAQQAKSQGYKPYYAFIRPRTLVYALVLAVGIAVMIYSLATRSTTEINILHERSPLFISLSDGSIRNGYTLKILNMARADRTYAVALDGIDGARLSVVGAQGKSPDQSDQRLSLPVSADSVGTFQVFVTVPKGVLRSKRADMTFIVTERESGQVTRQESLFAGP